MPTDPALKRILAARNMKIVQEEEGSHGPSSWNEISDEMYQAAENVIVIGSLVGLPDDNDNKLS